MSLASDDDSQQNFILAFVLGLIAFILALVIGLVLYMQGPRPGVATATATVAPLAPTGPLAIAAGAAGAAVTKAPDQPVAVAEVTETVTAVVPQGAGIRVRNGVVNFYFESGSADIAPGAAEALATVIKGVQSGRRAVVSGYHDTTGDPAQNDRLAKERAQTVQEVLVGLGVPAAKVRLEQPAVAAGSGNDAEARRVEVKLVD